MVEAFCMYVIAIELYERTETEKKPLLEEEGRLRVLYNTEVTALWQQQKHVKMMTTRLADLTSQVEDSKRQYENNLHMIDKYKEKLRVARLLEVRQAGRQRGVGMGGRGEGGGGGGKKRDKGKQNPFHP